MTEREQATTPGGDSRTAARRLDDHATIDRLADELLPSLVARLGATGLGELEVREGDWRVRLRRPAGPDRRLPAGGRAAPGRSGRSPAEDSRGREMAGQGAGTAGPVDGQATGDRADDPLPPLTRIEPLGEPEAIAAGPVVATSPAVGIFRARGDLRAGARVRAGDRLGAVDVLGVPAEVGAPLDGMVASSLVEDGDAVEYGQPLIALEPLPASASTPATTADPAGPAGATGGG
jgi:acetyl-CoA carboxylase biotin carboxyl carrier protein